MVAETAMVGGRLNRTISDAISTRRVLAYATTVGEGRVVEPHAYGITAGGEHALLSWRWETRGGGTEATETEPTKPGEWEFVRLDEMRDVRTLDLSFETPQPGYRRGDRRLRTILAQL